ncbi:MAG TPA: hypothetical protein VNM24_03130 [Burkholderiales bacterium]|nr:hypothetical protein [Burkholderiales bacterium]
MRPIWWFLAACLAGRAAPAAAGCGTAFCSLSTDWSIQGAWTDPGSRVDLRYEFIDQNQPRTGTRNISVGDIPQHHDEIRTINRNWIVGFEHTFGPNWSTGLQLPIASRSHSHIHNHHGAQLFEAWNFTEVGDARIVGRYRFAPELPDSGAFGLQFGLKLPTGKHNVKNTQEDLAERSLQPGSGTVDAILGGFFSGQLGDDALWFTDATWTSALAERDNYKPGKRVVVILGATLPWTTHRAFLLQFYAQWKDRDSGSEADPENTGGAYLHVSPGVSFEGRRTQIYSFVQLPLYQRVNGVQLVADWALVAGLSRRF